MSWNDTRRCRQRQRGAGLRSRERECYAPPGARWPFALASAGRPRAESAVFAGEPRRSPDVSHLQEGAIVVTRERFARGMTVQQYIDQMSMNKERLLAAVASTTIGPADARILERDGATRRVLVITEDWCGAAIASLPFVIKLVEPRPDIETRIFLRDENPDLMDQFLKNGVYRSIPVFVFFDEEMHELARYIERRPA